MIFEQIPVGIMQNFSYLIGDEASKEAAVVDPGWEIDKILQIAKKHNLNVKIILLTHTDYDHINGVNKIVNATDATVYVHKEEENEIKKLKVNKIKIVNDNDEINIGKIKVKVIHTPGHTPGSICYLAENKLITGDTLFVENIGRVDRPISDADKMAESLKKLKKLDEKIEVYPGHDYGSKPHSTIAHEKKNNAHMMEA
ncbi:MAG: MBL fold metallo-hydrolase [Flavobacteriales bacterium]|jgi:glyoxylase-like metal-dependent hydrolase (beta-lactamase superfamily II)|nr:MBL fold metallo-hydrolase [Flavobacteriales bacterium]|tara:strand:- start:170 stop:766 length:597 start_codon:yes stop_codon:yes gene_type:complete